MYNKAPGTPLASLNLSTFTYKYLVCQGITTLEGLLSSIALLPDSWKDLFGEEMLERIKTDIYILTGKTISDYSPLYTRTYKHIELRGEKMYLKGTKIPVNIIWIRIRQKTKSFPLSKAILTWAESNWEHPSFPLNILGKPCIPPEAVLECVEYCDKNTVLLQSQAQEEAQRLRKMGVEI